MGVAKNQTQLSNLHFTVGFPGGASGKEPACQCRRHKRLRFDPWIGKVSGGGNGNPFQYSCLENPMERGAWWTTVHRVQRVRHAWCNLACILIILTLNLSSIALLPAGVNIFWMSFKKFRHSTFNRKRHSYKQTFLTKIFHEITILSKMTKYLAKKVTSLTRWVRKPPFVRCGWNAFHEA